MMTIFAILLSVMNPTQVDTIPVHGEGTCNAKPVRQFVGRAATKQRIEWARKRSTANYIRKSRTGEAVTEDYRTDRLNIVVDRRHIIRRIYCG